MTGKFWIGFVILLFSLVSTFALPQSYEATSVSRIVGDSPLEMRQQLTRSDLIFNSAGFTDSSSPFALQGPIDYVLSESFGQNYKKNPSNNWIQNSNKALLVYNSQSSSDRHDANQYFSANNLPPIDRAESLVVSNSQYSGISLPKTNSIADKLSPKSTLVAPMADESQAFLKTLICNIGRNNGLPIGETFRLARNNYHWNSKANDEIIGLGLLSYSLYGNPFAKAKVPQFSGSWRNYYCDDVLQDFSVLSLSAGQIINTSNGYERTWTFNIPNYTIEKIGDYDIIDAQDTENQYVAGELILPGRTVSIPFPKKTIITGYNLTFSNPISIKANISTWNGKNYTNRICYTNQQNETYDISQTNSPESQFVIVNINPIRINDCEQGDLTLYQTASVTLVYYPYSPVRITSIDAPREMLPEQLKNITVNLENFESAPTTGTLYLKNSNGIISVKNISTTQSQHKLELYSPSEEGKYSYIVEFSQNGIVKTNATFGVDVVVLQADLELPNAAQTSADVKVLLSNKKTVPINTQITAYLNKNGQTISQQQQNVSIQSGDSAVTFTFNNLQKVDQNYDIIVTIPYGNRIMTLTGSIITNNAPKILNTNVIYNEGEIVEIIANATDLDGDSVIANIISKPFPLDGSRALDYNESGRYTYIVEASDGVATVQQELGILVLNTNRAPVLSVPDNVSGMENQQLSVAATAADPDNENSVVNDDNNVTVTFEFPLDSNGTFTPDDDAEREYYAIVTASDGYLSDSKIVKIIVDNLNRAPHLNDLTDITIKETEAAELQKGRDPDNENNNTNDDQTLIYTYYNAPIGYQGRWQTNYENSGVYNVRVDVSDGIATVSKTIKLTVENVNRPPLITAPDLIYANSTVDLRAYVRDFDNENSVANDDNDLVITCGVPFVNCTWTPTQSSNVYTYIEVFDGEYTVRKNIQIYVQSVAGPPSQTPPELPVNNSAPNESERIDNTTLPVIPIANLSISDDKNSAKPIQPQVNAAESVENKELEFDFEISGKSVQDGDKIKVKPDKSYKMTIFVKNNGDEDRELEFTFDLDDLDQKDKESILVKYGEKEELEFNFDIPRISDNDEYILKIKQGSNVWNFILKIDKPKHDVNFRYIRVEPEKVACLDDKITLTAKLENLGKNDEEGSLIIKSDLGSYNISFSLPQGESVTYQKMLSKEPGTHNVLISALYGKYRKEEIRTVNVEKCVLEEAIETNAAVPETKGLSAVPAKIILKKDSELQDIVSIAFLTLLAFFFILVVITTIKIRS